MTDRRRAAAAVVAVLAWVAAASPAAAAGFPGTPDQDPRTALPNDPGYAPHEGPRPPTGCLPQPPPVLDEDYGLFGFAPRGAACTGNLQVGGVSADRAWQLTLGRPDVVIAVVDTGIDWSNPDLRTQVHLNQGELPPPEDGFGHVHLDAAGRPIYDLNDNGRLDVDDYADDPRVLAVDGGSHHPTGADLIHAFSSWCTAGGSWHRDPAGCATYDNDGNGYPHDIAGWNFLDDTNDPTDRNSYSSAHLHGTGRAEDATAAADNGIGGVGTCPRCTFMPLRVDSFFITDTNAYAAAAVYAADNGASVLEIAAGDVTNTPFARAATAYAVAHGVVVVGITQDLNTADHLYPGVYPDVLMVAGAVTDVEGLGASPVPFEPGTYFRISNTDGPDDHVDVTMGGTATGSAASAKASGIVGLLLSRARELYDAGFLDRPLSPLEAVQVLERSADPVTQLETVSDCPCPPSVPRPALGLPDPPAPGDPPQRLTSAQADGSWSQYFGYGRLDARRALEMLGSPAHLPTPTGNNSPALPSRIPPEISLRSPDWWTQVDPSRQPSVALVGYVGLRRPGALVGTATPTLTVDAAGGVEPDEASFHRLVVRPVTAAVLDGTLATLDTADLAALLPTTTGPPANPNAFAVTLRVRVRDASGRLAEERRVIHLHHDATARPGLSRYVGSGITGGIQVADLRGDGRVETVLALNDGTLHVLDTDGRDVPWFHHGTPFLSRRTQWATHTGAPGLRPGVLPFPASAFYAGPAVGDLFGDGRQEIVAADIDGRVYALDADGNLLPGVPVGPDPQFVPISAESPNDHRQRGVTAAPVLGHLDDSHRDQLDIVVGALDQRLYVWRPDGSPLPGFPVLLQDHDPARAPGDPAYRNGASIFSTPAVADLLGDGHAEIVAATTETYSASPPDLAALLAQLPTGLLGLPANVVDAVLTAAESRLGASSRVYAVDGHGHLLPGWPVTVTGLAPGELGPAESVPPVVGRFAGGVRIVTGIFTGDTSLVDAAGHRVQGLAPTQGPASRTRDKAPVLNFAEFPSIGRVSGAPGSGPGIFQGGVTASEGVNVLLNGQNLPFDHVVQGWDPSNGEPYPAFPVPVEDYQLAIAPAIGPVGDPAGPSVVVPTSLYEVHALDGRGREAPDFPKFTGGWGNAGPTVADLDGRGHTTVLVGTKEGWLWAWDTGGTQCDNTEWWAVHHDEWNTGSYGTDTRPPGAITDFHVVLLAGGAATARWTASGGDGRCGRATAASVRVAPLPITPSSFAGARELAAPTPAVSGTAQEVSLGSLDPAACTYVALQVRDAAGNRSPLAETVVGPTTCPPVPMTAGVTPTVTGVSPATGAATPGPTATTVTLMALAAGCRYLRRRRSGGLRPPE